MVGDRLYKKALQEASGENPNNDLAESLLLKAISKGHGESEYALGTWFLHGKHVRKDLVRAIELLKSAALKNVPSANFDLGVCYDKGEGAPLDKKEAFKHYLKAALLGDARSIYEVGRCYYHGIGIEKDVVLANIWLGMAEFYGVEW
jgi:uncharacterized protein